MRDITFRTLGATAVLIGIAIAAIAQIGSGTPSAMTIEAADPSTTVVYASSLPTVDTTLPPPEPFHYRVGILADITTDNFWAYHGEQPTAWNAYVLGPTKSALYAVEPGGDINAELAAVKEVPALETDEGGWFVRVVLDESVRWSDGKPLTSRDLVFTYETVRRLELGGGWADSFPIEVTDVISVADNEVEFRFSEQPSLRVWPYGVGLAPVMAEHVWRGEVQQAASAADLYAASGAADVSGGPLMLTARSEDAIEAVRSAGYAGGAPDAVTYRIFEDESAAVEAIANDEIDTILSPKGLSAGSVEKLSTAAEVTLVDNPSYAIRYLGFNLGREPMSEPAFRSALALLLDRSGVVEALTPESNAAVTLLPPSNTRWYEPDAAARIAQGFAGAPEERLAAALDQLTAAGYAWAEVPSIDGERFQAGSGLTINGREPVPLTILTAGDEYDPVRPEYAKAIESTLELLGFDVRPIVTDFNTVVDLAFTPQEDGSRQYDMYLSGWTLGNPAFPHYYGTFFSQDGAFNSTGYSSAEFEAALTSFLGAHDREGAADALWEMERLLAADLPYLSLYHPTIAEAYRSDRVRFDLAESLGGIQARAGALTGVTPAG